MQFGFSTLKEGFDRFRLSRDLLVLLVGGVLLIGVLDYWMIGSYKREGLYRQSLMAQQLQAQVQTALEEHVTALLALNVVYQNFVEITQYDFQQYGDTITMNLDGFRRLFFVDPDMVIQQIYPYNTDNSELVTRSLHESGDLPALFEKARRTQKPVTSGLLDLYGNQQSVLAITPVYRGPSREFLGYAIGELSLRRIWEPYSHADFLRHYDIELFDHRKTGFFNSGMELFSPVATRIPFEVGDKKWTLMLMPRGINTGLWVQRMALWSAGIMILFLSLLLIQGSRRHRAALGEAQKQFETVFKASPDGIVLLDERLGFKLTNQPVREWSGVDEEALESKGFFDLFSCHCPHLTKCRELSYLLCTSDQFDEALPEVLEAQVKDDATGNVRTMRLSASRLPDQKGFIAVLGDISTAKELDRVKETYIATLTHDLKTPLLAQGMVIETVMGGTAGPVSEQQQTLLTGAHQSVKDLVEMVDATLVFYKLEASHLTLQKNRMPVAPLIREVMESLQPLAQKREITFALESSVVLPELWVDPVQIKRVFHNILSNAVAYAGKATPIHVWIDRVPDKHAVLIAIRNEGKGIEPQDIQRIFDKYYSLSRKFKQIGTGLGLYISKRIVELHGGKLWAESTPGQDAVFYIQLPCPQEL